jgi:threonine synthase
MQPGLDRAMSWQPTRNCDSCGASYGYADRAWRCHCGGTLSIAEHGASPRIDLGEGSTPVVRLRHLAGEVYAKLEFMAPTGSFKDRGAATMIARLRQLGIDRLVDDSAGNAGVSIAAYCAAGGIHCHIYVAASANLERVAAIRCYGGDVTIVAGQRNAATAAALADGAYYAGHAWDPFFVEGMTPIAGEILAQMRGAMPTRILFPLGQGTLLLGLLKGFEELLTSGALERMPQLVAVQTDAYAPFDAILRRQLDAPPLMTRPAIVHADGIAVANPVRWRNILLVFQGKIQLATARDAALPDAVRLLGREGLLIEPTSAVVVDALLRMDAAAPPATETRTLLLLTASALKTPAALARMMAAPPAGDP